MFFYTIHLHPQNRPCRDIDERNEIEIPWEAIRTYAENYQLSIYYFQFWNASVTKCKVVQHRIKV